MTWQHAPLSFYHSTCISKKREKQTKRCCCSCSLLCFWLDFLFAFPFYLSLLTTTYTCDVTGVWILSATCKKTQFFPRRRVLLVYFYWFELLHCWISSVFGIYYYDLSGECFFIFCWYYYCCFVIKMTGIVMMKAITCLIQFMRRKQRICFCCQVQLDFYNRIETPAPMVAVYNFVSTFKYTFHILLFGE